MWVPGRILYNIGRGICIKTTFAHTTESICWSGKRRLKCPRVGLGVVESCDTALLHEHLIADVRMLRFAMLSVLVDTNGRFYGYFWGVENSLKDRT